MADLETVAEARLGLAATIETEFWIGHGQKRHELLPVFCLNLQKSAEPGLLLSTPAGDVVARIDSLVAPSHSYDYEPSRSLRVRGFVELGGGQPEIWPAYFYFRADALSGQLAAHRP